MIMSDTEFIAIGRKVNERMPQLSQILIKELKPNSRQRLEAIAEVLSLNFALLCSKCKKSEIVDARTIYIAYSIASFEGKRSKVINELIDVIDMTSDGILYAFNNHIEWMQFNSNYRSKYLYVSSILND